METMKIYPIPEAECSHVWANTGTKVQGVATVYCILCGKNEIPKTTDHARPKNA